VSEQNKALARRYYEEVLGQGKPHVLDEIASPDLVDHDRGNPTHDLAGAKQFATMARSAFPDVSAQVDDVIAEDDRVVVRATVTGTHRADFLGVPASGRRITITCIDILRCASGKIVEHWGEADNLGMLQQLGVIATDAPAP
jgi:steroid delta-isomerase-like uncharacterized protein